MVVMKHEKGVAATRGKDLFTRFFDDGPFGGRPFLLWPPDDGHVRVEEFKEDSTLVIRAELAGINPDKDVTVKLVDGMLRLEANKQEKEVTTERDYVRREFRYGSFMREFALPRGVTDKDVVATYKDGILELRVHLPADVPVSATIPVATT